MTEHLAQTREFFQLVVDGLVPRHELLVQRVVVEIALRRRSPNRDHEVLLIGIALVRQRSLVRR